jgi:RNA polymerase sigma factor (sigma-70 family)
MRLRRGLLQRVTAPAPGAVMKALVDNHQRFLAFLERRVGSRETAEDILQDGFVRALERADTLRDGESASAWFYRLLRNALVDHYRRRGAEDRALVAAAVESQATDSDDELRDTICACVNELITTLKPEYATALRRVELEGERVDAFAREVGITATNASVRLHRARETLRRRVLESCGTCVTHSCRDCECGEPGRARKAGAVGSPLVRISS